MTIMVLLHNPKDGARDTAQVTALQIAVPPSSSALLL